MSELPVFSSMNSDSPNPKIVSWLFTFSCIYLGLPYLAFFSGWLRWWIALPVIIVFLYAVGGLIRQVWLSAPATFPHSELSSLFKKKSTWVYVFLWIAVCLAVMSLSGAGGVGPQNSDYLKHNAVLKHLVESPWPVWLQTEQGPFPLVYYTAWYLPAAVVGKWAGWYWANATLFLWTFFGLLLSTAWFTLLVGKCRLIILAVFFLFSAPDILGAAIIKLATGELPLPGSTQTAQTDPFAYRWWYWNLGGWHYPCSWHYGCPIEFLFWVPHQAIGSWISSGMMITGFLGSVFQWRRWSLVPLSLCALWSPLAMMGLVCFLVADLLADYLEKKPLLDTKRLNSSFFSVLPSFARIKSSLRIAEWISAPNLASFAILTLMGCYFGSRFGPLPFSEHPWAKFRFLGFADWSLSEYLYRLLCFEVVEVGTIAGLILLFRPFVNIRAWALFILSLISLVLLPLFRYGINNDLAMRASIPGLFVFSIFWAKAGTQTHKNILYSLIFFGALSITATTPLLELYRHLEVIRTRSQWVVISPPELVDSLWELNIHRYRKMGNTDRFIRQYVGCPNAFFFRYLSPPSPEPFNSLTR